MRRAVYSLYLYSTKALVLTLLGFIVLGTVMLVGLQHICSPPAWIQYVALTMWIAGAFVVSGVLVASSARFEIGDQAITITQKRGDAEKVLREDIETYAFYEELTLYSLKIALRNDETISIIDFKWHDDIDFQSFLKHFESWLNARGDTETSGAIARSATFYESRTKVIITVVLLVVFISIAIIFLARRAFGAWNPIVVYYFWALPVAFFVKMLKAK